MRVEKVAKTEAKRQTQKDRRKKSRENCRESLTCAKAGKEFMRAIEVRKRQGKQGLREICVGTSREGKGCGNISVGNFRWVMSALKRFELSGIGTRVRGNPEARRSRIRRSTRNCPERISNETFNAQRERLSEHWKRYVPHTYVGFD